MDQFQHLIETSTRFLDDVVSANSYVPGVPQLAVAAHRVRRIGLGIMGLGDLMYKLGVRYGSGRRSGVCWTDLRISALSRHAYQHRSSKGSWCVPGY
ncbi:MAG: hypothetical protein U0528_02125 [Anaerolineae bacterium]